MTKQTIASVFTYLAVLMIWGGVTQALPWGPPSANKLRATDSQTKVGFQVIEQRTFPPYTFTTARFDEEMPGKVSTLSTDKSFSWIVSQPLDYYNPAQYMTRELVTQGVVAIALTAFLFLTASLRLKKRMLLLGLAAITGSVATYGQLLNWWGLTRAYGLGAALNTVVGWMLGGFVVASFIVKSTSQTHSESSE